MKITAAGTAEEEITKDKKPEKPFNLPKLLYCSMIGIFPAQFARRSYVAN